MMPAVMMAPAGMGVPRGAMIANDARAIRGHHHATAWSSDKTGIGGGIIVIGIIRRVVVVIDAVNEHPAKAMPVSKPMTDKPGTACADGRSGAECTAANG